MNHCSKIFSVVVCALVPLVCAASIFAEGTPAANKGNVKNEGKKQSVTVADKGQNSEDTLVVVARLAEIPGDMPPNDVYNYVFIMKFKATKIVKGTYGKGEILIGVYNPLIARKRIKDAMAARARGNADKFEIGATYRLTLVNPIEKAWTDAVEDNYPTSKLDKYYAVQVDAAD